MLTDPYALSGTVDRGFIFPVDPALFSLVILFLNLLSHVKSELKTIVHHSRQGPFDLLSKSCALMEDSLLG